MNEFAHLFLFFFNCLHCVIDYRFTHKTVSRSEHIDLLAAQYACIWMIWISVGITQVCSFYQPPSPTNAPSLYQSKYVYGFIWCDTTASPSFIIDHCCTVIVDRTAFSYNIPSICIHYDLCNAMIGITSKSVSLKREHGPTNVRHNYLYHYFFFNGFSYFTCKTRKDSLLPFSDNQMSGCNNICTSKTLQLPPDFKKRRMRKCIYVEGMDNFEIRNNIWWTIIYNVKN